MFETLHSLIIVLSVHIKIYIIVKTTMDSSTNLPRSSDVQETRRPSLRFVTYQTHD
jgi:hypothetical protein